MRPSQNHLDDAQFMEYMLGAELDLAAAAHVDGCESCKYELARFRSSVGDLSTATMRWTDAQQAQAATRDRILQASRKPRFAVAAWGAAAVAMLALGVSPLLHRAGAAGDTRENAAVVQGSAPAEAGVETDSAAQIAQDNKLMRDVTMEIAQREPSPYSEYELDAQASGEPRAPVETRLQ